MARGRMINNEIARDKRINELCDDTSRLAFTWLITFADREGRTPGDPAVVRSMIFPRRGDISIEQMEHYIREWTAMGLIQWYESNNDLWISFTNFDKHQTGLRKGKESASHIPPPPLEQNNPPCDSGQETEQPLHENGDSTEEGRNEDGLRAEDIRLNGMEKNGMEFAPDGANETPMGIIKNPGAYRALQRHEERKARGDPDLAWLDEYLWPLAKQFIAASNILPLPFEYSKWKKDLRMFYEAEIAPEAIPKAIAKMRKEGLSIKTPGSVFGIARDMEAVGPDRGDVFWEVHE